MYKRQGQKGLIAAAAVLAVALAGVLAWQSLFVRPDLNTGKTEPQETEEPTDPVEEIDWGEGTRPRSDGERKSQDYYTVLILGRDTGGGGNTDTMLLASYDVTNQKATVMSIPRDTMVNVSWDIKKINSVYNTYGGGDRGIQALYKEISQLVGFEPDYQVIVELSLIHILHGTDKQTAGPAAGPGKQHRHDPAGGQGRYRGKPHQAGG